ncbi:hypothetical protein A2933_02325 [Candidatus Nomurabacteria bacterium RIFCSPLOWO2_01_FULL_46_18]|uniref:Glycosyltransferase subfamily 4-like N-terminal domain-containing protein n=1 Tax=Candidatus Nomurabacteria bacterium RIFCSPLOWO2_01_FULL_46_18 TaxID=1801783 RepID=A0A1F6XC27_9BACT|nr:MAG: hypothetical protein A2933_02325 [Candidatus Nomurabacteria bacterium RIFCSPLOWO2_01_FULL_46_18]
MKIFYGITKSNFGGAQRYVFELATETKKMGHDVVVLSGGQGALVENLTREKIKVITLNELERDISIAKEFSSFSRILKVLREERPDVFHINSSKMGGLGGLAGRLSGTRKIIFTTHGWAFNEPRPCYEKVIIKLFAWLTILFSHKTICVSEKTRRDVEGWPFIKNKLIVINNGIREFNLAPRTDNSFTVGTTSELHRVKGLDILLLAWNKFVKKHKAVLMIFNEGGERKNLQNMATNLGISDSVVFKGFVDNARSSLSGFDIFCMPSRSEAMPYALLEAGLAGLPVIATNVGGIPEIIESGISGILIPTEDSEALFSSLILLSEDAELRKRLGINLKHSIQENFSFEKMVKQTFQLYLK